MTILELSDLGYPAPLRAIPDAPELLYCDGMLETVDAQAIAVVGSRRATPYGLRVARTLAHELSRLGFTIVSGMARGIDGAAHEGALAAGGRTIAVLGCGVDVIYPPDHRRLREEIVAAGALLSELPPGSPPLARNFPRRNRILSGLSLGVIVVEAAEDSGSLITAKLALDQGREVFAVPGSIEAPTSRGTHRLLKEGAKLTETVDDIVEELLPQFERPLIVPSARSGEGKKHDARTAVETTIALFELSPDERKVYALVGDDPMSIDELTEQAALTPAAVARTLLELELKNAVQQLPGQRYHRSA
jgi:DNA processing protein